MDESAGENVHWLRISEPAVAPSAFRPEAGAAASSVRRTRKYWLAGSIIALGLILAAGIGWWNFGRRTDVHYIASPVTRGDVVRAVTATGTVNPELTIIVGTYVSGVIQQLFCDYNTVVRQGQVCAKIDPRPYQTMVDEAKANLSVAEAQLTKDRANLTYAKLAYERNAKLLTSSAVSQDAVDNAKSVYDQAQAQITFDGATIQQRKAALEAAQVNLGYTDIISPVDGIVVSRNVTTGQTVAASFQTPTLFLIATDLTKMQVDTDVSEGDIGSIKAGSKATFTVDAYPKRTFEGIVSQVRQSPQTIQNVVTYDVVVAVNNSDAALRPGMTATVRVVVDERRNVLRVPNEATRYFPSNRPGEGTSQPQVWMLHNGEPSPVSVQFGLDDDSFSEVVSGDLKPGDRVITAEQAQAARPTMPRLRL